SPWVNRALLGGPPQIVGTAVIVDRHQAAQSTDGRPMAGRRGHRLGSFEEQTKPDSGCVGRLENAWTCDKPWNHPLSWRYPAPISWGDGGQSSTQSNPKGCEIARISIKPPRSG